MLNWFQHRNLFNEIPRPRLPDVEAVNPTIERDTAEIWFRWNQRLPGTHDLVYQPQFSTNLVDWTDAGTPIQTEPSPTLPTEFRIHATDMGSGAPAALRRYGRVKVTLLP